MFFCLFHSLVSNGRRSGCPSSRVSHFHRLYPQVCQWMGGDFSTLGKLYFFLVKLAHISFLFSKVKTCLFFLRARKVKSTLSLWQMIHWSTWFKTSPSQKNVLWWKLRILVIFYLDFEEICFPDWCVHLLKGFSLSNPLGWFFWLGFHW